jgi:RNA polymerase sigma-70 factor (ECF subfamily)
MAEDDEFTELIRRIRGGDAQAANELIRKYEPAIRREARLRLGPKLRPLFDSMDLCQSVLGSFFVRVRAGQYELSSPAGLMKLLVAMTRNKVREKARKKHESELGAREPVARGEDHTALVLTRDFLNGFRQRLTESERVLWDRRNLDHSWQSIGVELGENPAALRKQYSRAIQRVERELGLEEHE